MLSLGIEAALAFWTASDSAGLPSTSPPPSFAATVMARASLVKSLPRRASTIAFLCLIPAHLECPDMRVSLVPGGVDDPLFVLDPRPLGMPGHARDSGPRRRPATPATGRARRSTGRRGR